MTHSVDNKWNICTPPPVKPLDLVTICVVLDRNSIQPIFSPTSDNRITCIRSVRHWKTQVNAVLQIQWERRKQWSTSHCPCGTFFLSTTSRMSSTRSISAATHPQLGNLLSRDTFARSMTFSSSSEMHLPSCPLSQSHYWKQYDCWLDDGS